MDRGSLKLSIDAAMSELPPALVKDVAALARKVIVEHRAAIERVMPTLAELLMPVVQTCMMEKAMGILDGMEVLGKYGIHELPVDRRAIDICSCGSTRAEHEARDRGEQPTKACHNFMFHPQPTRG